MMRIRDVAVAFALLGVFGQSIRAEGDGQLRLCLRHDPKTFDPLLVQEESSEAIRYLTGGVLVRMNRSTQKPEPELAASWKISPSGRRIDFQLRPGLRFSDGTPFSAEDVAFTFRRMMDPALRSPIGDLFRAGGPVQVKVEGPAKAVLLLPGPIAGVERLLDQVTIMSAHSAQKERAVLGPFVVAEYKSGSHVLLKANPNYWKRDSSGRKLPYLESVRFDLQSNRDLETLRFRRGELHMIHGLDAETFESLNSGSPQMAIDAGPSYDTEMLWFNQVARAPIPSFKKAWFRSSAFRKAISRALNREDIVRLVYRGHAQPAAGPYSSANRLWFNGRIKPDSHAPEEALRALRAEGFRLNREELFDVSGNRVELSLITNAGNKSRARIASLIQDDLVKLGIRVSIVPLDFPSLIERITRTFSYDACLLGLVNVDADPNGQMNVWLSSGVSHQWNPGQPAPETEWEAEIDRLMRSQAATLDFAARKRYFDRVQEIVAREVPFIYLVSRNSLVAVSPRLKGVAPSPMFPQLYWNAERLSLPNTGGR